MKVSMDGWIYAFIALLKLFKINVYVNFVNHIKKK